MHLFKENDFPMLTKLKSVYFVEEKYIYFIFSIV